MRKFIVLIILFSCIVSINYIINDSYLLLENNLKENIENNIQATSATSEPVFMARRYTKLYI